ncbi:hypothetical protein SAMN06313540_10231 [Epsilonproteobacteria bacterium SCGC AD-308-E02]|nr:hypothetical protein SAMN06313540_10231 [Epsilonproteobacteria bacterium SCGC AD-308-E02]
MSFLDIGDHSDNFFYIIEISIGANKILKYGKTNSLPRLRFAQIKNDIKENYRKFHISIKPLVLAYYNDIAEFEDMVKVSLSEHNIGSSNYKFAGSSETFSLKDKDKVLDILNISAGNLSNTDKLEILYDEMS